MQTAPEITITVVSGPYDKATNNQTPLTWEQFVEVATTHHETPDKDTAGGFFVASFKPGADKATKANAETVYVLPIDLDKSLAGGELGEAEARTHLQAIRAKGVEFVAHTSHSYNPPDKSTWHVFIRLSKPIPAEDYRRFWKMAMAWLGVPSGIKTDNAARYWHRPSCPPGGKRDSVHYPGFPLDVDWILSMAEPEAPDPVVDLVGPERPATRDVLNAAWEDIKEIGPAVSGEDGHNHTYRVARNLVNDWALSEDEAFTLMEAWNVKCEPPWTTSELLHKIRGAADEGPNQDHGAKRSGAEFQQVLHDLRFPPGSPVSKVKDALDRWNAYRSKEFTHDTGDLLLFKPLSELWSQEFPPTPWLITGLLMEGGVAAIAAEPKAAKTWAAMEWCLAIATGGKAFGEYQAVKGTTVYLFAEDYGQHIQARTQALVRGRGLDPKDVAPNMYVQPAGVPLDLTNDNDMARILASLEDVEDLKLLVVDPLRDLYSGDENDSKEIRELMHRLRQLSQLLDCTVLFVHHNAKSTSDNTGRRKGQMMRGSGAIHGAITSGFYMTDTALEHRDNGTSISSQCHVEVKGARAAPSFALTCHVTDDDRDMAHTAKWVLGEDGSVEVIDENVPIILRKIQKAMDTKAPLPTYQDMAPRTGHKGWITPKSDFEAAWSSVLNKKFVEPNNVVVGGHKITKGWRLTDTGYRWITALDRGVDSEGV